MYIAVVPYKGEGILSINEDKVLIFDTTDATVEYISLFDVLSSGIQVFNINGSDKAGKVIVRGIDLMTFSLLNTTDYFRARGSHVYIGSTHIQVELAPSGVVVDGTRLMTGFTWNLMYVFKYNKYHVLRFSTLVGSRRLWCTAVTQGSDLVAYWSSDNSLLHNKAIMLQIDTVLEV